MPLPDHQRGTGGYDRGRSIRAGQQLRSRPLSCKKGLAFSSGIYLRGEDGEANEGHEDRAGQAQGEAARLQQRQQPAVQHHREHFARSAL